MPARPKGPRLYWRDRADGEGVWEIRDTGGVRISTRTASRPEAEAQLAEYIARKWRPSGPAEPSHLSVSQALALYLEEHAPHVVAPERLIYAVEALDRFWTDLPVSAVKAETCRRYMAARGRAAGTVRRELGTLQAALNHCHRAGYLTSAPLVTMPPKDPPRERWLTRREAAWLLRAARALRKDGRHLADFILCGLYTGSRKATILALRIDTPSLTGGHIDTIHGILYRRPGGKRQTAKRQTPARLPAKYLAHVRRQAARGRRFVVEDYTGAKVGDIRKGWSRAVELAVELAAKQEIHIDLSGVTPHVLKHTAITWAMQRGADKWAAAGFFGTSVETIERVYGHHSPDHMRSAVEAMDRKS
jgi:integrase